jgi:hypothetical protein
MDGRSHGWQGRGPVRKCLPTCPGRSPPPPLLPRAPRDRFGKGAVVRKPLRLVRGDGRWEKPGTPKKDSTAFLCYTPLLPVGLAVTL